MKNSGNTYNKPFGMAFIRLSSSETEVPPEPVPTDPVEGMDDFASDLKSVQFELPTDLVQSLRRRHFIRSKSELLLPETTPDSTVDLV